MKAPSLVARVASVQLLVIIGVLGLLLGIAFVSVSVILNADWDRQLEAVAGRYDDVIREYVAGQEGREETMDEMDEHRPPGTRVEIALLRGGPRLIVGKGPTLEQGADGCRDLDLWRQCQLSTPVGTILVGRSRVESRALRNRMFAVVSVVALVMALVAGLLSRLIVRRAMKPLVALSERVADVRPGAGERIGELSRLAEIRLLVARFDDLLGRVDEALLRERRFSSEASHELKTPLTVLRGEVDLWLRSQRVEHAEQAMRSVDKLIGLVESLLWFARTQDRFDPRELDVVNVADVIRTQVDLLRSVFHGSVTVTAPDEVLVRGNERLLGRAVANLVENGLKHSSDGAVAVDVAVRNDPADIVEISIEDGGAGIGEEIRARIFEPFFRGPRERASTAGFGLGLPLARSIARVHGGDVVLAKTSDRGTRFVLTIPLLAESVFLPRLHEGGVS